MIEHPRSNINTGISDSGRTRCCGRGVGTDSMAHEKHLNANRDFATGDIVAIQGIAHDSDSPDRPGEIFGGRNPAHSCACRNNSRTPNTSGEIGEKE